MFYTRDLVTILDALVRARPREVSMASSWLPLAGTLNQSVWGSQRGSMLGFFYGVARDAKAKAVSRYTGCFFTDPPIKISIRGPSPTQ